MGAAADPIGSARPARETLPSDMLSEWTSSKHTRSGAEICIRPLRPDDRVREIQFVNSLSERTRYLRLMTPIRFLSSQLLDQFMDIDYDQRMAFVATTMRDGIEAFVGVVRYGRTDQPDTAELGITVTDGWQRDGVGRLLIDVLSRFARHQGFKHFIGIVLPENHRMLAFANRLGFDAKYNRDDHLVHISYDLATTG